MVNRDGIFKKGLVFGIILLFVGASVTPSISGDIKGLADKSILEELNNDEITNMSNNDIAKEDDFGYLVQNKSKEISLERSYDWPTFQHDMQRTGFTDGAGNITSPSIKWRYTKNGFHSSPAIDDIDSDGQTEIVFVSTSGVYAFDGDTGVLEWCYSANCNFYSHPTLGDVDDDGEVEVLFGALNYTYCLDGSTGTKEWSYATPPTHDIYCSPAIGDVDNDGAIEVIVTTRYGKVFCLCGSDGSKKWEYQSNNSTPSYISPSICDVDDDSYIEIFLSGYEEIICLDGLDGNQQWKKLYCTVFSTPSLGDIDDDGDIELVFCASYQNDDGVFCLDAETGQLEWEFLVDDITGNWWLSPAIGDIDDDGDIEVVVAIEMCDLEDDYIYCLDGSSGDEEWNYTAGNVGWSPATLGDVDGDGNIEIILGNQKGKIYCLSGENGTEQWNRSVGYAWYPAALGDVDDDGKIEIAIVTSARVYCLDNDFGLQPPVVIMNGPYRAAVGEEISFDASESYDPDGYIVGYRWDWTNDGIWDTEWLSSPSTTHVYNSPFNESVRLECKDNENLTDSVTESVWIFEPPDIVWNRTYNPPAGPSPGGIYVQQTSDGGYILTGEQGFLLKTNSFGDEEWNKTLVGDRFEGREVHQTSDGGFFVVGYDYSSNGTKRVRLFKTNNTGGIEWNKTYYEGKYGISGQETSTGEYIVTGWDDNGLIFLLKADSNGNKQWFKNYTEGNGFSVRQTSDGGYIIACWSGGGACLIKTDSSGNEQWNKSYPYGTVYSVQQTLDNGFILTGSKVGHNDILLLKTDYNGNEIWNKSFGGLRGLSVEQTTDHGYIIGGQYMNGNRKSSWLIKTDQNGSLTWWKKIPQSNTNNMWFSGTDAHQTVDGGYILLTNIHSKEPWLIKFGWVPPTAKTGGPYYSNPGYPVQFDGTNSHDNDEGGDSIVQYDWKFFDDDSWHNDTGPKPSFNYTSVGNYTVTLRVFDDEGDNDTDSDPVIVDYQPHPPTAEVGGPYSGMEDDDPIQFNASGSHDNDENGSSIVRYDWKFFEGDTWHNNLTATPTYIYSDEGDYTVKVRVHDDEGFTDTDEASVEICAYQPPVANPGGPYSGMEDTEILFDASGSYDPDEYHIDPDGYYIDSYRWDFNNDGSWDTGWLDFTVPTYSYTYFCEYYGVAKLEVKDDEGNTSTATASVNVEGYKDPVADPDGPYYGINGVPVQFDGSGSHDCDQNGCCITVYRWKYFDGDSWHEDGATPTHTYSSNGVYTVTLNVTDDDGDYVGYDEATTTVTVESYQDPIADAGGPYNGNAYSPVTFDASGSCDGDENGCCITGYRWDWTNDGSWDTGWLTNPVTTHTYASGFTGSVKLQVKDDDPGGATDTDTAQVTIQCPPPTANFQVQTTNNPSIFKFDGSSSIDPRPGHDYHDLTYSWDIDNDGSYDDATGYLVTWSFSTSGQKTISLKVENPDGSDTCTDTVTAFNYKDINIQCSNPNFFFSYPGSGLPALKNRYYFTTPSGVFTKVTFQIGSHTVTDTSGNTWEGILEMSKGSPGDSVIIKGYSGSSVVWTKTLPTRIIITPTWFVRFLENNCFRYVNHYNNYGQWKMFVLPKSFGITYGIDDVPVDYIGGDYGMGYSLKTPGQFVIDSSSSLKITKKLVEQTISLGIGDKDKFKLGEYVGNVRYEAGGSFSHSSSLEISDTKVTLVGYITLEGYGGVSFDIPIFCIPFLAEAGFTGGVRGSIGVGFEVTRFTEDGLTFCPGGNSEIYYTIGGHAGLYGEVLAGLARVEGGLEAEGKCSFKLPSKREKITLYVGAYAQSSFLWGFIKPEKWTYGTTVTLYDSQRLFFSDLIDENGRIKVIKDVRNMDLLCLKDFNRGNNRLGSNRGITLLGENIGESAVPKVVLTDGGEGVAVWSDITLVDNSSAFQSDIYWSTYDGNSWGSVENTNTSGRCEYDPELVLVDDGSSEYVVLTFLAVDHVINETTDPDVFYAGSRIHTALWSKDDGWRFEGENLLISGGTVNTRSMCADESGNVFMCYLVDTDCDPWESGIGKIYVVNGSIVGDELDWNDPTLIRSFDDMPVAFSPKLSFINESVGGIVYSRWNESTQLNETVVVPTVSGIDGFSDVELLVNSTNLSVGYVSSVITNDNVTVFWVENHSRICQTVIDTDQVLVNWVVGDTEVVYSNMSVVSLKPVSFDEKRYLLFQRNEDFTPYVIEELSGDIWGNLRQVSLEGSYSLGQVDGDSNGVMSMITYLADTSLEEWLVGRWRFNEGNDTNVSDSSDCENHGVLVGSPMWVEHVNDSLDPVYGFGLCFNGTGDYVEIPYDSSLSVQDEFTSTCWVKLNSSTVGSTLLGVNGSWQLREVNGSLEVKLWRSDGLVNVSDIAVVPLDTWTFIGVIYNHGVLKVVVRPNGLDNTSALFNLGDCSINSSVSSLIIGGFVGCIEEVWLFNRDISMSEVDSIWFTPYPTLGSIHDVVVQHLPSFASFSFGIPGRSSGNITTEDTVEFTGSPSGFTFGWDFGDGTSAVGENVSHQYDTAGLYNVICNATNSSTGAMTPVMQTINVIDTTPPVFSGLESATAGDCNATLNWSAANDTAPFVMYHGFMHNETGSFNYSSPCFVIDNTSYTVDGLVANETYYFLVRAVDAAGNSGNNSVVMSATPVDTSPPVFEGLGDLYMVDNYPGSVLLEWNESVDPSPPIMYNVYMSNVSGGQNFNSPYNSTNLTWILISGLDLENESYYFVVRAEDVWGNEDNNTVEKGTPGEISVSMWLSVGWNLITVPFDNNLMASMLAENITGCVMVSWFDAVNQTYESYIVGGPPQFDFFIVNGYGYFVLVNDSSFFNVSGYRITNVSVPLFVGWNMIGWSHDFNTTASSLAGNITNCTMVSKFDAVNQSFESYIVGGPSQFDFTITPGMGIFILVDVESIWYGEG